MKRGLEFMQRGYPKNLTDTEMGKVVLSKEKWLRNERVKGILFVITNYLLLGHLARIIQRHSYLLHMNIEIKKIFAPNPYSLKFLVKLAVAYLTYRWIHLLVLPLEKYTNQSINLIVMTSV